MKNLCKHIFDAILMDSGRKNTAKLVPKSCQKSMLISNGRFSRKPTISNQKSMFFCEFWDPSWVPKYIENQSKNLLEAKVRLSIDFSRFWSIWGGKLGSKWLPKSMQKRIEKTMQIQMRFGCVLGGCSAARAMESGPRPPPYYIIKKKTNQTHKRTCTRSPKPPLTPCATSALADTFYKHYIYIYIYIFF